jgi:hypothetical protein
MGQKKLNIKASDREPHTTKASIGKAMAVNSNDLALSKTINLNHIMNSNQKSQQHYSQSTTPQTL